MWDVIVIGGGPGGVSCAIYSASRGKNVLLIEKGKIGGTVRGISNVTHYSGILENETGESFSARLEKQLEQYNIEIVYDEVIKTDLANDKKLIYTSRGVYECNKLIIANGATPRRLGVKGEDLEGVFLNDTKDYVNFINDNVYVVGGSDGAIKESIYLASKVKSVTIICNTGKLTCIKEFKDKLNSLDNVYVLLNSKIIEIKGDKKATGIIIENTLNLEITEVNEENIGIFIYAGSVPNTDLYLDIEKQNGYILVDNKMETNILGVYACGDIISKDVRQIATAVSDGAIAGINASL